MAGIFRTIQGRAPFMQATAPTQQSKGNTQTSHTLRGLLKAREQELEIVTTTHKTIDKDIAKVKKEVDKVQDTIVEARKAKLDHLARGLETRELLQKNRKLRDIEAQSKQLPNRIQTLEDRVSKLKQELASVLETERTRKAASKSKTASANERSGIKQQVQSNSPKRVGSKRKSTDDGEQRLKRQKASSQCNPNCAPPQSLSPTVRKNIAAKPGSAVQASSRKQSKPANEALKPNHCSVGETRAPKAPAGSLRRRQRARQEAVKAAARFSRQQERASLTSSSAETKAAQRSNGRTTTEVATPSQRKKRSAPVDEDADDLGTKRQKLSISGGPRGLTNHGNACFANAVIQLLATAFEDHDIDSLIGKLEDVECFGFTEEQIAQLGVKSRDTRAKKELRNELRDAIKTAGRDASHDKLSAAKHFRKVLEGLRTSAQDSDGSAVSPYLLQSIVAWGAARDADRQDSDLSDRQRTSGDTQQDAFLYCMQLLGDLIEDPAIKYGQGITSLFKVDTKISDCCNNNDCDFEYRTRGSVEKYHNVDVPNVDGSQSLGYLFKSSLKGATEEFCSKCDDESHLTAKSTFITTPDEFVVRLNRQAYRQGGKVRAPSSKIMTAVDLESTMIVEDSRYELAAVVMHKGTINRGHYTAYRKYDGNWYFINDEIVVQENPDDLPGKQTERGEATIALYKKTKA